MGVLRGMNAQVHVPCDNERRIQGHFMLERAGRIAFGSADPRPCLACQSEWSLGQRPPRLVEVAREILGLEEEDGRKPRTYEVLRFAMRVGREPSQLD